MKELEEAILAGLKHIEDLKDEFKAEREALLNKQQEIQAELDDLYVVNKKTTDELAQQKMP